MWTNFVREKCSSEYQIDSIFSKWIKINPQKKKFSLNKVFTRQIKGKDF